MLGLVLLPREQSLLFRVLGKARGRFPLFMWQQLCGMLMLADTWFLGTSVGLCMRRIKSCCSGRDEEPGLMQELRPQALIPGVEICSCLQHSSEIRCTTDTGLKM